MDYSSRPVHWKPLILAAEKAQKLNDPASAEVLYKHAIAAAERALGNDHTNVALSYLLLGDLFFEQERFPEAELSYHQATKIFQNLGVDHELFLSMSIRHLSAAIKTQGRTQEASELMTAARQLLFECSGAGGDDEFPVLCVSESDLRADGVSTLSLDVGEMKPLSITMEPAALRSCSAFLDLDLDCRFSAEQIVAILQASEAGASNTDLCKKYRIPDSLLWDWKSRYGGLCIKDVRHIRQIEQARYQRPAS